jgi:hypothetical protein
MFRPLIIGLAIALTSVQASAVINQAVEDACQSEYVSYCMGMAIPSEALRSCFRGHMMQLSKTCLKALADNGEATKADVAKYLVASKKSK